MRLNIDNTRADADFTNALGKHPETLIVAVEKMLATHFSLGLILIFNMLHYSAGYII